MPWCFDASRAQVPAPAGSDFSLPEVAIVSTADELTAALQSNAAHVRIVAHLRLTRRSGQTGSLNSTYFALPKATLKTITARTLLASGIAHIEFRQCS